MHQKLDSAKTLWRSYKMLIKKQTSKQYQQINYFCIGEKHTMFVFKKISRDGSYLLSSKNKCHLNFYIF